MGFATHPTSFLKNSLNYAISFRYRLGKLLGRAIHGVELKREFTSRACFPRNGAEVSSRQFIEVGMKSGWSQSFDPGAGIGHQVFGASKKAL